MLPETLADVLVLYKNYLRAKEPAKRAEEIFNQTQTAIYRYTLPGWGHAAAHGRKPTQAETAAAQEFLQSLPVNRLLDAPTAQEKGFEMLEAKPSQRYTYGSKLKNFLAWAKKQGWWPGDAKQSAAKNRAPRRRHGYGGYTLKRVTNQPKLPNYRLEPAQAPALLASELEEFHNFLTRVRYPGRKFDALKPGVAKRQINAIYRILGWFLQHKRVTIEQLKLNLLIPKLNLLNAKNNKKAQIEAEKSAMYVDSWLCEFLDFLENERNAKSYHSLQSVVLAIYSLVRFQYNNESDDPHYNDIPITKKLRQHLTFIQKRKANHQPIANEAMKWLDLPDILRKIVMPLREECAFRDSFCVRRPQHLIARSFQAFVIWGCFTLRPPRRQQEFRDLKIGTSCPVTRPKNIASNHLIHPLPNDRNQDKYHGYLFKDEYGMWYVDMLPEGYKTGKTYGHQKLPIPNTPFPDGKSFYDYLEAFLYGYYRDGKGNWCSGGQDLNTSLIGKAKLYSLRMLFNPKSNHVFVTPTTGKAFIDSTFPSVFKSSAHRLTGQLLTPHLLRDIFATWFLDQEYTEAQINSLAYAMAHSPEMLRAIYDRRRPQQKNRPIEETMASLVQQFVR